MSYLDNTGLSTMWTISKNRFETKLVLGACTTEAATSDKIVSLENFALYAGVHVFVKFTNANTYTAGVLTLNVNSTTAKQIAKNGSPTSSTNTLTWAANAICEFVFDGTYWVFIQDITADNSTPPAPDVSPITKDFSWTTGTWSDIALMLKLHYLGLINVNNYWSVGDVRQVQLDEIPVSSIISNSISARSIDIVLVESTNAYTISGTTQPAAFMFNFANVFSESDMKINTSGSNLGGWNASSARIWMNDALFTALPQEFRSIIQTVDVKTANGGSLDYTEVVVSQDKLFLPAEQEIFGETTYANLEEAAELAQWDYYKTASNRIKSKVSADGTVGSAANWWLRSADDTTGTSFCCVSSTGTSSKASAETLYGCAAAGCI